MKPALAFLLFLLYSPTLFAQEIELQHRDAPKTNDFSLPGKPMALTENHLNPDTPIPPGMVWASSHVPEGWKWIAREEGSCEWCGRPMSFKQAAFDKKMSLLWISEIGLAIADTEIAESRRCLKDGSCREGNPFLGPSRAQQYAIRMPVLLGAWMVSARLRQGNRNLRIGGMKHWWVFPVLYQAASTAGILANLSK